MKDASKTSQAKITMFLHYDRAHEQLLVSFEGRGIKVRRTFKRKEIEEVRGALTTNFNKQALSFVRDHTEDILGIISGK